MTIKRVQFKVKVACNRREYPKGTYRCGYLTPELYVLEAGNPPGTEIFDTRAEPPLQPPVHITLARPEVFDATHVVLACQCNTDSDYEEIEIRIISFYEI